MTALQALLILLLVASLVIGAIGGINKGMRNCDKKCVDDFTCNTHFFSGPTCDCGDDNEYETGKCTTCAKDGDNYACS